jgi:hypothetical protein
MNNVSSNIRAASLGLFFSVLTILFGQILGVAFGLKEADIKDRLKSSAESVLDTVYKGDLETSKSVQDKSWTYFKRAHLHAGSMGTTAVVLILLMSVLNASRFLNLAFSLGLGLGSLGYSFFWLWAGLRAPTLGSTTLAKESLKWLAMPSSGVYVLSSALLLYALIAFVFKTAVTEVNDK